MKRRAFFSGRAAGIATATVAALCALLVALIHANPGFTKYAGGVTPFFILQPESVTEEAIADYAGVRRTYTLTLPESNTAMASGARLYVYLRHTIAEYSVEGTALRNDLSEHDAPHIGRTPGNYWVSIPMRPEYAGKTARFTLTPVYENVRNQAPVFMVITRDTLLSMIVLPADRLMLVLSSFAMVIGAFMLLYALGLPLAQGDKRRIFYLGAVTVTAGLWKLCAQPSLTLFLDHLGLQKEIWYTGSVSYLLMLVLSMRVLVTLQAEEASRASRICFFLSVGAACLLLVLQMLNVLELHQALIGYGVGMAVLHAVSLLGQRPSRQKLLWLFPFFISMGADLLILFFTGSLRAAPVFLIWIMLNLFLRSVGFIRETILRERLLRRQEAALRDEKVRSLVNQIRPHFIYNTLVSVYELCRQDPEQAMRVISDFTTYLQSNFTAISATELIPFSVELQHTQAYLAVETTLHGDDLRVTYDTSTTAFRLPPLTLQPIVENAVKHGVGKGYCPEHIVIRTRSDDDGIRMTVENDGTRFDPGSDSEVHVGLENVRKRLIMMCGGTLDIATRPGGGVLVTVTIPGDGAVAQRG